MTVDGDSIQDKIRILTIDDEEIVHASLRKILSRAGYEIESVYLAKEGLELLKDKHFDLTIVDLMMPEMNGLQFLEALRESGSHLSVLMVTGYPTIGTAVHALRLGAVDYIAKPFTRKELLSPVQRALSISKEESIAVPGPGSPIIKKEDLTPGTIVVLPRHSWAKFKQDGTFLVGIEKSFLNICEKIESLTIPDEMDLVEQGYIGIYLRNEAAEEHGVAIPLSGQVVEINLSVLENPLLLEPDSWLVRIIPSHLNEELGRLVLLK
ncbi:MAG: response regulator [Proteobacteria bacterium]|nr:response regulator [Pseudomonadota bacterium]